MLFLQKSCRREQQFSFLHVFVELKDMSVVVYYQNINGLSYSEISSNILRQVY